MNKATERENGQRMLRGKDSMDMEKELWTAGFSFRCRMMEVTAQDVLDEDKWSVIFTGSDKA